MVVVAWVELAYHAPVMGSGDLSKRKQLIWLGLIGLTAVFLRLYKIASLPPGLTHDEADHGITAWSIVNGERAVYFTVGYGREPLYDYATAVLMRWLGPTYLAGRLTAVFFSLITLILLYIWTKKALNTQIALLATAGYAVSFWSTLSARQSLRSITLNTFFIAALYCYFTLLKPHFQNASHATRNTQHATLKTEHRTLKTEHRTLNTILSALLLGLTFYTYIPARAMWLILPGILLYLALVARPVFKQMWGKTAVILTLSAIVASPLFRYLRANPDAEVRIDELSAPLTAVRQGNIQPLWQNISGSLRLFFIEGDSAWRYNIAGKPWLSPWLAAFFLIGLGVLIWWSLRPFRHKTDQTLWQGTVAWTILLWFGLGFAPVLVTGPELSSTQAIGMQPMLYLLVGVGVWQVATLWLQVTGCRLHWAVFVALFGVTAVFTFRDYLRWGAHPEVRVQYESTMFSAMDYVNENARDTAVSISTITPGKFHTPALADMTLTTEIEPRWFDASGGLLIPNTAESVLIIPGFTPLADGLSGYFETAVLQDSLPLQPDDKDRPLDSYTINQADLMADWQTDFQPIRDVWLGEVAQLVGVDVQTDAVREGDLVRVATLWQLHEAIPAETRLFTHMVDSAGVPIAQADRLSAPAESWQNGDWLVQLHEFWVPQETAVGIYPLTVGIYQCVPNCQNGQRFPVFVHGFESGTTIQIGEVEVIP